MKKIAVNAVLISLLTPLMGFSSTQVIDNRAKVRISNIRHYVANLQNASVVEMGGLFDPDGFVYSTSVGKKPALPFFSSILPYLLKHHAKVFLHAVYKNGYLPNTYIADFTLTWKDDSGKVVGGHFSDIFRFTPTGVKLHEVDMFEAL